MDLSDAPADAKCPSRCPCRVSLSVLMPSVSCLVSLPYAPARSPYPTPLLGAPTPARHSYMVPQPSIPTQCPCLMPVLGPSPGPLARCPRPVPSPGALSRCPRPVPPFALPAAVDYRRCLFANPNVSVIMCPARLSRVEWRTEEGRRRGESEREERKGKKGRVKGGKDERKE